MIAPSSNLLVPLREQQRAMLRDEQVKDALDSIRGLCTPKSLRSPVSLHQAIKICEILARTWHINNAGFEALADLAPRPLVHALQICWRHQPSNVDLDGSYCLAGLTAGWARSPYSAKSGAGCSSKMSGLLP